MGPQREDAVMEARGEGDGMGPIEMSDGMNPREKGRWDGSE